MARHLLLPFRWVLTAVLLTAAGDARCRALPTLNRHEKVAKDAADWLPELNRCWFARTVIAVRQEYGLTIDRREADALDAVLEGCE